VTTLPKNPHPDLAELIDHCFERFPKWTKKLTPEKVMHPLAYFESTLAESPDERCTIRGSYEWLKRKKEENAAHAAAAASCAVTELETELDPEDEDGNSPPDNYDLEGNYIESFAGTPTSLDLED
jgi:hypothetical protein